MAKLFVVSTPIGNLQDLSARAGEILGSVARIFAEDTRRTRVLLDHLGAVTPLSALHEHNEEARADSVVTYLDRGQDVALVSDAGTPIVSDPGARLVNRVLEAGHEVVPVPGPSAVLAALVASGIRAETFAFLGFVPKKGKDRRAVLERVADSQEACILFESPERIGRLLRDLESIAGADRHVAVARELTKLHEEFVRGTMAEAASYYADHPVKGEVTVVVAPGTGPVERSELDAKVEQATARAILESGLPPSAAARELARRLGLPRARAYDLVRSSGGRTEDVDGA
jgi:16S rRNA (cytidine1402-2'-O)-methyltransferase